MIFNNNIDDIFHTYLGPWLCLKRRNTHQMAIWSAVISKPWKIWLRDQFPKTPIPIWNTSVDPKWIDSVGNHIFWGVVFNMNGGRDYDLHGEKNPHTVDFPLEKHTITWSKLRITGHSCGWIDVGRSCRSSQVAGLTKFLSDTITIKKKAGQVGILNHSESWNPLIPAENVIIFSEKYLNRILFVFLFFTSVYQLVSPELLLVISCYIP